MCKARLGLIACPLAPAAPTGPAKESGSWVRQTSQERTADLQTALGAGAYFQEGASEGPRAVWPELGCYPLLHRVPFLLLPSPTMSADQRMKAVGGWGVHPQPSSRWQGIPEAGAYPGE